MIEHNTIPPLPQSAVHLDLGCAAVCTQKLCTAGNMQMCVITGMQVSLPVSSRNACTTQAANNQCRQQAQLIDKSHPPTPREPSLECSSHSSKRQVFTTMEIFDFIDGIMPLRAES